MSRVGWILILLVTAIAARAGSAFGDAGRWYADGKFEEAKRAYEEGLRFNSDANMLFNHGNACFRLGEHGRAILSYERALVASPSHPEAAENLKFVRNRAGSRIPEPSWRERALSAVPRRFAPWLAIGVSWIGCAWGAFAFARRRISGVIGGAMLVALAAVYAAGLAWMEARLAQAAIVVESKVEARSEPADRATIAEILPAGSRVRVLGEHGAWKFCDLPSGGRGWLPADAAERIFATAAKS